MKFEVDPLPFSQRALEPYISERTVDLHYNKHHCGYMSKLDAALESDDTRREMSLEKIIAESDGKVFNCAAQVWNHTFYWNSLDPSSEDTHIGGALHMQIERDFGTLNAMKDTFKAAGAGEFGSGWAWLSFNHKDSKLEIVSTTDAENPLPDGVTPLLTIDVWEHAYYLDYQNERGKYLTALVDGLLNWKFASDNFNACS